MNQQREHLIESIQASGFKSCLVTSGGGSGAIHALLSHAGASRFILEVQMPYSRRALFDYLGEELEHACSEEAAATMAARAFERAVMLTLTDEGRPAVLGIACTAALQTIRDRRGEDRAHIGIKSQHREWIRRVELKPDSRTGQEEQLSSVLLDVIAECIEAATE